MVAKGARSCLDSSCKISHFGAKPESGGRPPRDNRRRGVRAVSTGVFDQEVVRELMVVALLSLNTRKVENVIIIYMRRAMKLSWGENCIISIIQPRWAIDE